MPYFLPCWHAVVSCCRSAGGLKPAATWMYQQLVRLVSRLMNMTEDVEPDPQVVVGAHAQAAAPDSSTHSGGPQPTFSVPTPIGAHPEAVARLQREFSEIESVPKGWEEAFGKVNEEAYNPLLTFKEARKPRNRPLNRYKNVSPYDHSRVVLTDFSVDYVNANLVEVPSVGRRYILSQGPLECTASHFWLMLWQQKTKGIIMLNTLYEKKIPKCFQYWPDKIGESLKFFDVQLAVKLDEESTGSYCTARKFSLTKMNGSSGTAALSPGRIVTQFHYTTWPDFGAPRSPGEFLEFLKRVRDSGVLELDVGPAVVHCSAGIGRSGTFCLVDVCLIALAAGWANVSVRNTLVAMRHFRMGLVQTPDQYRFAFQAILKGIGDPALVPAARVSPDTVRRKSGGEEDASAKENGDVYTGVVKLAEPDDDEPEEAIEDEPELGLDGDAGGDELDDDEEEDKSDLKRPAPDHRERETESPAKQPKTAVNRL